MGIRYGFRFTSIMKDSKSPGGGSLMPVEVIEHNSIIHWTY